MTTGARRDRMLGHVLERWRPDILPLLDTYARIPNLSPAYEPGWEAAGHMAEAATLLAEWARRRDIPGAEVDVLQLPGLTPTVVVEVPATDPETTGSVLVYGHYDKQPPFDGWSEGRGPWSPVLQGDRLYARGVADDGYALPSALLALEAVAAAGGHHARCVIIAEGSEESGSPHLPAVLAHLADQIGVPDVVVALDSGSPTYDRLWITTSLRGAIVGSLTVRVLDQGIHSGSAGAVVPSSFRLARLLLDRVEDPLTGDLKLPELQADPPPEAYVAAGSLAAALTAEGLDAEPFPVTAGLVLQGSDATDRALRTAWLGSVAVVGADGLPPSETAGAVLLPFTTLKLVIRLPPTVDADSAEAAIARALTTDPPNGATVTWTSGQSAGGWSAPRSTRGWSPPSTRPRRPASERRRAVWGREGRFPSWAGWRPASRTRRSSPPGSSDPAPTPTAPNESLHLPTAERVTASLAMVLDAHARSQDG